MPYKENGIIFYYYGEPRLEAKTDLKSKYGKAQKFAKIWEDAIAAGGNWSDPEFPHNDDSVGNQAALLDKANPNLRPPSPTTSTTWIRIPDLCNTIYGQSVTPNFTCGDLDKSIARFDVQQGQTGDCWFLSSIADVAMVKSLINIVVPKDNSTNDLGIYHYRFWYEGKWVDIVVDDYVPCNVDDSGTCTVGANFCLNNGQAEFWPMLLEKAFAKLNGSYQAIASNIIMNALESLTGGFGEYISINGGAGVPKDAYKQMSKWLDRQCVIGAGTTKAVKLTPNAGDGIKTGHAYSVTGIHVITTDDGTEHKLVRLRNPWGHVEWKGHWSDGSSRWDHVSDHQKEEIGFVIKDEGEFWMSYDDFLTHFDSISGCFYYDANVVNSTGSGKGFAQFNTSWSVTANTAGGFQNPVQNPLYEVEIKTSNQTGILAVGLMVQTKIANCNMEQGNCIRLFAVGTATTFDPNFFANANEIYPPGSTSPPGNWSNSYSQFYELPPGKYIVVPTTLQAGQENTIIVRIFNDGSQAASPVAASTNSGSENGSDSE